MGATIFIPASVGLWLVARQFPESALQRWTALALLVLGVLLLIARLARERARNPVEVGQTTRLWFDPRDPGNQRRIVVELAEDNLFDL